MTATLRPEPTPLPTLPAPGTPGDATEVIAPAPEPGDATVLAPDASPAPSAQGAGMPAWLGRYEVAGEIGHGGMGTIVAVNDRNVGRELAAKVLREPAGGASEYRRRFLLEAQVTGRLQHPNIVPVHEIGEAGERPYFVMKRVHGRDLDRLLRERHEALGSAPAAVALATVRHELLAVFDKVCDGVAFAHSRGVIHRDLKPANVMVGEFGEVLVLDWGLAKLAGVEEGPLPELAPQTDAVAVVTRGGVVMGTPHYMAPEQARAERDHIDLRADVHALGAMLYQILTFCPPYEGQSTVDVLRAIAAGELKPPSVVTSLPVPWELEAVVMKAMAARPEARYADVPALQADLERYLAGGRLAAAQYSRLQLLRKAARRHRAALLSVTLLVLVSVLVAGWFVRRDRLERRGRLAQATREADRRLDALPSLSDLETALATGAALERPPADLLAGHLGALFSAQRGLALAPGDEGLRRRARRAAIGLGLSALLGDDLTLAARTFEDLPGLDVPAPRVHALQALVERRRHRQAAHEAARLQAILADLTAGLSRPGRDPAAPLLEDYELEALRYRHAGTLTVLGGALDALRATRVDRLSDGQRDAARFCCRVLGRLGTRGTVEPLGRWLLWVLREHALAVEAGLALCHTRQPSAYFPLIEARRRLGADSVTWLQIAPRLRRVPAPTGTSDDSVDALLQRAGLRVTRQEYAAARPLLEAAVAREPRHAKAQQLLADVYRLLGRPVDALAAYDRALALNPEDGRTWANRAIVAMVTDPARALADVERALALLPDAPEALMVKGQALWRLRQPDRALEAMDRALRLGPSPKRFNNRALLRLAVGQVDAALADCDRAIALDPRLPQPHANRALALQRQGHPALALAAYDRALELDPRSPEVLTNRGILRKTRGDWRGALADFDAALELESSLAEALAQRAHVKVGRRRYADAIGDLDRLIALEPRRAWAHRSRGDCHRILGKHRQALVDLTRGIELAPRHAATYFSRSLCRGLTGDVAGARADLDRAIALDPRLAEAYQNRAILRGRAGDAAGSRADLDRAIALNPRLWQACYQRALMRVRAGDVAGGRADYDRALAANPRFPFALVNRAQLMIADGDVAQAEADLRKAVALDPTVWQGWWSLGQLDARRGRVPEARAALRKALDAAPREMRSRIEAELGRLGR